MSSSVAPASALLIYSRRDRAHLDGKPQARVRRGDLLHVGDHGHRLADRFARAACPSRRHWIDMSLTSERTGPPSRSRIPTAVLRAPEHPVMRLQVPICPAILFGDCAISNRAMSAVSPSSSMTDHLHQTLKDELRRQRSLPLCHLALVGCCGRGK